MRSWKAAAQIIKEIVTDEFVEVEGGEEAAAQ